MKRILYMVLVAGSGLLFSCKKCYDCKLTELSAQYGFIVTDSMETCDKDWVKENSYPDDVNFSYTWHCKVKKD